MQHKEYNYVNRLTSSPANLQQYDQLLTAVSQNRCRYITKSKTVFVHLFVIMTVSLYINSTVSRFGDEFSSIFTEEILTFIHFYHAA